jgi:hypothetical protein
MSESSTAEKSAQRHNAWAELGQFYARQMTLLDEGNTGSWGDTFTEDVTTGRSGHLPSSLRF